MKDEYSWTKFMNDYESKHGALPSFECEKFMLSLTKANVLFLKSLKKVDGRTLKWHINSAIEMYIQQLGDDKK